MDSNQTKAKTELDYIRDIGELGAQIGFYEGALLGILMSSDTPDRIKESIKTVLDKYEVERN